MTPTPLYSAPYDDSGVLAPHVLVTVDPGGRLCAIARWYVTSDRVRLTSAAELAPNHVVPAMGRVDAWVVERPHIRGLDHEKRHGVEVVTASLDLIRGARAMPSTWKGARPSAWKGNVPKTTHHHRVLDVACAVGPGVRAAIDPDSPAYNHNIADAVALGLWALGIVGRGGVRR